jgi:hypothetical protein
MLAVTQVPPPARRAAYQYEKNALATGCRALLPHHAAAAALTAKKTPYPQDEPDKQANGTV